MTLTSRSPNKTNSPLRLLLIAGVAAAIIITSIWLTYRDTTTPPKLSSEYFAELGLAQSAQRIADATVAGGAPGVLILIRKDGQEIIATAGTANKLTGEKMPADEPLRIGSVSKLYTATVILSLAGQGLIDLDAKITNYLGVELIDGVANTKQATVRQLLSHTSGIPDYYDLRSYFLQDWRQPITLQRTLPVAKRGTANFVAGERFEYSNMGYVLLGEIAEKVSGKSLANLINDTINKPFKFENTYYNVQHADDNRIHGYGTIMRPWADTYELWEHSGPDGGITANASETVRFLEALTLDGGALEKVGDQMIKETISSGHKKQQGLGLETITGKGGTVLVGHTGDVFGYQTVTFAHPDSKTVFLAHINCDCSALSASLIRNIYQATTHSKND